MTIDGEAVDRILRAAFGRDIPDIDRDKLAARLSEIANLYCAGVTLRTAPAKRRKRVKRAIEVAKWLKTEVEEIFAGTKVSAPEPQPHSAALQRLIADLGGSIPDPKNPALEVTPPPSWAALDKMFAGRFSEFDIAIRFSEFDIAIHMLGEASERFFGWGLGYTRVEGADTQGRFVDFAKAALKEMKIFHVYTRKTDGKTIRKPYSSRTIESAAAKLIRAAKAVEANR